MKCLCIFNRYTKMYVGTYELDRIGLDIGIVESSLGVPTYLVLLVLR